MYADQVMVSLLSLQATSAASGQRISAQTRALICFGCHEVRQRKIIGLATPPSGASKERNFVAIESGQGVSFSSI